MIYWLESSLEKKVWSLKVWSTKSEAFKDRDFLSLIDENEFNVFETSREDAEEEKNLSLLDWLNGQGLDRGYELWLRDEPVGLVPAKKDREELLWNLFLQWTATAQRQSLVAESLEQLDQCVEAIFSEEESAIYFLTERMPIEYFQKLESIKKVTLIRDRLAGDSTAFVLFNHACLEDFEHRGRERRLLVESIPEGYIKFKFDCQAREFAEYIHDSVKKRNLFRLFRKGDSDSFVIFCEDPVLMDLLEKSNSPAGVEYIEHGGEGGFHLWERFRLQREPRSFVKFYLSPYELRFLDSLSESSLKAALEGDNYHDFFIGSGQSYLDFSEVIPDWTKDLPLTFDTEQERKFDDEAGKLIGDCF